MPMEYPNLECIESDDFADLSRWHHEGIGKFEAIAGGGMKLHCLGSKQGEEACMAFFRQDLPDQIAIEYDIVVHGHGGLVINYLAIRGLNGEDMIADRERMPPRRGVMSDYWAVQWGLQSYHMSFSRFDDDGTHTQTSNWRRNPGCLLVGHGIDPVQEIGRSYHMRITKDIGHCQLYCDGRFAHAFVDRDASRPIPDAGKFGFRLIGSDVAADIRNFRVYRIAHNPRIWKGGVYNGPVPGEK